MKATVEQPATLGREAAAPGTAVLVGLLGKGIQLSLSPLMHEAEGRRQQLSYIYTLLDTDRMGPKPPDLADIIRFAEMLGYRGLNITYPYKQEIIPFLDVLSPNAEAVGSVNTIVFREGLRFGHNTDLWGFAESFRLRMGGRQLNSVLLFGAGGAGAAVARALLDCGVGRLLISDIDQARARALAERLSQYRGADRVAVSSDAAADALGVDGMVNATPVGMASLPGTPIAIDAIRPPMWVADIIYFPIETEFLRAARRKGCHTMDGADMAVFQAARAFEHFTGITPDIDRMRADFAAQKNASARMTPTEAAPVGADATLSSGRSNRET